MAVARCLQNLLGDPDIARDPRQLAARRAGSPGPTPCRLSARGTRAPWRGCSQGWPTQQAPKPPHRCARQPTQRRCCGRLGSLRRHGRRRARQPAAVLRGHRARLAASRLRPLHLDRRTPFSELDPASLPLLLSQAGPGGSVAAAVLPTAPAAPVGALGMPLRGCL